MDKREELIKIFSKDIREILKQPQYQPMGVEYRRYGCGSMPRF